MDRTDELKGLARKCRELAAGITDEATRKSLELLARDYETRATEGDTEMPPPEIPNAPEA